MAVLVGMICGTSTILSTCTVVTFGTWMMRSLQILQHFPQPLKTPTSLNKESRPFFLGDNRAFGVYALFLPLTITAYEAPESYFGLAIIAFGAFQLIVTKYCCRLGKKNKRSLDYLN